MRLILLTLVGLLVAGLVLTRMVPPERFGQALEAAWSGEGAPSDWHWPYITAVVVGAGEGATGPRSVLPALWSPARARRAIADTAAFSPAVWRGQTPCASSRPVLEWAGQVVVGDDCGNVQLLARDGQLLEVLRLPDAVPVQLFASAQGLWALQGKRLVSLGPPGSAPAVFGTRTLDGAGTPHAVAVAGESLLVADTDGLVHGFFLTAGAQGFGAPAWTTRIGRVCGIVSVSETDASAYWGCGEGLYGVGTEDGMPRWRIVLPGLARSLLQTHGQLVVGTEGVGALARWVIAVTLQDPPQEAWRVPAPGRLGAGLQVCDDQIVVLASREHIAIDAATGGVRWRRPALDEPQGEPVCIGRELWYGNTAGWLVRMSLLDGRVGGRFFLGRGSTASSARSTRSGIWVPVSSGDLFRFGGHP